MKARTAGIAAITSKEFAQWIMPFEAASANTAIQQKINLSDTLFGKSCGSQDQRKETIRNVGIAVSGGVDSMALATLMAQHYSLQDDGRKTSLHAFIVDHKLRDNSTEEANYVAKQIQKLDIIPHVLTLNWTLSDNLKLGDSTAINKDSTLDIQSYKPNKVHLETEARLRRYKAITQKCYDLSIRDLFVGHHAGDQVETTLFRFSRASGIDGMAGIQSLAPLGVLAIPEALDIRVVRPLLQVSKNRLQATCEKLGTLWVEDPSNQSLDYQRNVIRHYQHHQDAIVKTSVDSFNSKNMDHPLSSAAILVFRDRMNQHRQNAWKQVTPWINDVWFDRCNGVCHLKLESDSNSLIPNGTSVDWLQDSQRHISIRLLSFLIRWVNCKDHNPRLEDIQLLLQNIRLQQQQFFNQKFVSKSAIPSQTLDFSNPSVNNPIVYQKITQRESNHSSNMPTFLSQQRHQSHLDSFNRTSITIAGVMISPPRKTKGVPNCWTISRQPMSIADQLSATITHSFKNDLDILWDQRFFIKMSNYRNQPSFLTSIEDNSQILVRPMNSSDVKIIQRRLQSVTHDQVQIQNKENGLKRLNQWMSTVPGNARYTIPIILSQPLASQTMNNQTEATNFILSLPTLDIHLGHTRLSIQSRFKSKLVEGAKDMLFYPQINS